MKLLACSDLHLGYRAYHRLTPGGINQREADVALTFRRLIDRLIALAPDVVVVAGDILDIVQPSNNAILHAFTEFSRLADALPKTIVVLVAGNHDSPKSSASGGLLQLFRRGAPDGPGIHIVDHGAKRLWFPAHSLSILGVPDMPGMVRPPLIPDPRARYNVLVLHGEVSGMLPRRAAALRQEYATIEIAPAELGAAAWTYVALGHWHCYKEIAPNAFYAGSLDFTSSNVWQEIPVPKGFVERDLETGAHTFHELTPSRVFVDLPTIDAAELTSAELDAAIANALGEIDDRVVRLTVTGVTRELAHALDQRALRGYKRRCLNLNLDFRRPAYVESALSRMVRAAPRQLTLEDRVREKLATRELKSDVDRDVLTARALGYIAEVSELPETTLAEFAAAVDSVASIEPAIPSPTKQRGAA